MEAIQKVYLVGLGAVGSAYAAKMNEAEPDLVKVIVDQERYEAYRDQEIRVNGQPCRFAFIPPEQASEKADLILIAVKGHHLADANALIRPFVGEKTIIMSLLNGITSEEEIGKVYGPEKLLHAFVVSTDATREGRSTRYSNLGRIVFGDKDDPASPKVSAVKALFDRTGVPYSNPPDILRELWWKFMLNVGVNQVSAVLKAPYGVFHKVKEARDLMTMACQEVLQIAERMGINLTAADIDAYHGIIGELAPEGKTSMLQDVEAGRKTEVESFAWTVVALGEKYGVPTPVNACLGRMISTLEQMYSR